MLLGIGASPVEPETGQFRGHPTPREADLDALDGRALTIVKVLAQSCGVTDQGDGKAVWAELRLP